MTDLTKPSQCSAAPLSTAGQAPGSGVGPVHRSAVQRQSAVGEFDHEVAVVRDLSAAAVLGTICAKTLKGTVRPTGYLLFREEFLRASGSPTDPVEVMMLEQLMWAHHRLGDLQAQASDANTPELIEVLNVAVTRVMGEFRRTSLALKEFRTPVVPKQITLVKQQNVAGTQQVAFVDGGQPRPVPQESAPISELVSNPPHLLNHDNSPNFNSTTTGRPSELAPAARPHGRGSPAPATGGLSPRTLDLCNRPQNGDR
jgi:hypothetical protein